MDMAMQLTGVPEVLFLPVAILESQLKPTATNVLDVKLSDSTSFEEMHRVYLRYFLGPEGYNRFDRLAGTDSIRLTTKQGEKCGIESSKIKNHSKLFTENGRKKGNPVNKKEALRRMEEHFKSAIDAYKELQTRLQTTE